METGGGDGLGQADIDHAGLNDRPSIRVVDLEDPVHPGHLDDDRSLALFAADRERSGTETRAGPARAKRDSLIVEQLYNPRHLGGRGRKDDRERLRFVNCHRIALIDEELRVIRRNVALPNYSSEGRYDPGFAHISPILAGLRAAVNPGSVATIASFLRTTNMEVTINFSGVKTYPADRYVVSGLLQNHPNRHC